MDIKLSKPRICWNGTDYDAAHELLRRFIRLAVYVSPLAFWKAWELINKFIGE